MSLEVKILIAVIILIASCAAAGFLGAEPDA